MRNKIFAAVLFVFVFAVAVSAPVKMYLTNAGVVETENVGNVIEVEKEYAQDAFCASFFNAVEGVKRDIKDIYTNYIPFYVDITTVAKNFSRTLNQPMSSLLMKWGNSMMSDVEESTGSSDSSNSSDSADSVETFEPVYNAVYMEKNSNHRFYEITAKVGENDPLIDFYVRVPSEDAAKVRPKMLTQIGAINDFTKRRPDVNWYIFPVICFEDTELCDQILPAESKRSLFTEFFSRIDTVNPDIQYDYLKITDIKEWEKLHYKTDHHWNVYGYTEGYRLIMEMFKKNYPDMEARVPTIHTFDDGVRLYGSSSLAVSDYRLFDIFHTADFSLPEHTYVREDGVSYGGKRSFQESMELYLNKKHSTKQGYNHYVQFSPIVREVSYPQNNTGRNLLIIGDSYSIPLLEVLASHFDNTYVRYVDGNKALTTVQYETLIEEYDITDVLLLEMSDRVIYNYYSDSLKGLK